MNILDNLNDMQRKASEKIEGPSLILAGAGSGKTRTVTYKIAHMVKECNIDPESILALTFTNKAANEMKERIHDLIGEDANKMIISTFHSFSVRMLRIYGKSIGFTSNFNIYDADDSKSLIKKIVKNLNYAQTPSSFYTRISKSKENGVTVKNFENEIDLKIKDNREFYEVLKQYQETLIKNNCMDFTDILLNCKALLDDNTVLEKIQNKFKYILVDEYQDTNNIQYQIVTKLAKKYKNLCVVGDEDQSIYAFRGADINNILNFKKDYPNALIVKLEQNYRSTSNILNLANSVISKNTSSLGKALWTKNDTGKLPNLYEATDPYDEARHICEIIKESKEKYGNFTILYRMNAQSRVLEQELNRNGITCKVYGGLSFYQRKEVKDLLSYLMFLNNPEDVVSFERCISNPKRKIGSKTQEKIISFARDNGISLLDAMQYDNTSKVKDFYNLMSDLYDKKDNIMLSDLMQEIIEKTHYLEYVATLDNPDEKRANVYELLNSIKEAQKVDENLTLDEYLTFTSLSSTTDSINEDNIVKLMTIHSSKGLEFNTVFLAGFESNLFPTNSNLNDISSLEEERRLCYVAITRAKKELYLSYCKNRTFNGLTENFKSVSHFYYDMDKKYIEHVNAKKNTENTSENIIENFNPVRNKKQTVETAFSTFKVGQTVNHLAYGRGTIKKIDDKSLTIDFIIGEKKISLLLADRFLK